MTSRPTQPIEPGSAATLPFLTRIRHWALIRILLEAAALFITVIVVSRTLSLLVPPEPSPLHGWLAVLKNILTGASAIGIYTLMIHWLERRSPAELDPRAGAMQLPIGLACGMALMAAVYAIFWIAHLVVLGPGTGFDGIGPGLAAMFLAGVFEELLFRGVLFRIVEQASGTASAVAASGVVFGLAHAFNPGATLYSDATIAIEAGLLLAVAYALTRNLWLVIGIHAGWNIAEAQVFGAIVSGGTNSHSLYQTTLTGPVVLTGGAFGPEASIISLGVCVVAALFLGVAVIRRGNWKPLKFQPSLS